jgi:ParB-like chromosome segregation protein Spo0J
MEWKLQTRQLKELKSNEKNPRRLTKEQFLHLEKSLSKFGVCEPIVINTDNTIIGGHQRVRVLKKMGKKEIEVYVPDETIDQKDSDELNIRLNKNTGDWDYDILANNWDVGQLVDWGFNEKELAVDIQACEENSQKSSDGKTKMVITFSSPEDLQDAENKISTILDQYKGAVYKVKL